MWVSEGEEIKYSLIESEEGVINYSVIEGEEIKYSLIQGEEGVIKYSVIEGEGGEVEYLLRIQEGCAHMT